MPSHTASGREHHVVGLGVQLCVFFTLTRNLCNAMEGFQLKFPFLLQ